MALQTISPRKWSRKWKCQKTESIEIQNKTSVLSETRNSASVSNPVHIPLNTTPHEKTSGISKRLIFILLGFIGMVNAYTMRVNLSVAIVAMAKTSKVSDAVSLNESSEACLELIKITPFIKNTSQIQTGEFDWDPELQQLSLASFYFGYMIFQIPGAMIAEKHYAKHFFGGGVLLTTILTLLTPMFAKYSVWALIISRAIQGSGQAVTLPAMNTLIGRWVPLIERSRATAFIYTGATVGAIISFAASGALCDSSFLGGWPSAFYVFGFFGCIWYVFWHLLVHESPEDHPYISKAEIACIRKDRIDSTAKKQIPWRCILTSLPVWGLVITHTGQTWGYYSLLTETPIYLNNVLHYDLNQNGVLSSLPSLISALTAFLGSIVTDKLRAKNFFKISTLRKIMNSVGFYGTGLCMLCITFVGCSSSTIVILLCLAMGFNGISFSGFLCTHVDMSPEYAGILMAITNTFATLPGFLAPIYVGWIIKNGNTLHNWGLIFITIFIIYLITGSIYNILCSSDLQQWKPLNKLETSQSEKKISSQFQSENKQNTHSNYLKNDKEKVNEL